MIGRGASLIVWAVLGTTLLVGQMAAVMTGGRLPGLGRLVRRVSASRSSRGLVILGWMWLGWHAFAR
ncbi:MAG TPA: DUF6186 family protein [Acidimicrobiales bacterium]|jgi:hypothetical protein